MPARPTRRSLPCALVAACGLLLLAASLVLADEAADEEAALRARAEGGEAAAQLALALALGSEGARQEAAVWFARAAARGDARAQHFLGQLYETGTGVPRAPDRARAWYDAAAGQLPAAAERLDAAAGGSWPAAPVAPELQVVAATEEGRALDVVWTSAAQPEGVVFHVAAYRAGPAAAPVAVAVTALTAVVLPVPPEADVCCVRVVALALAEARYAASDWASFRAPVPRWAGVEVVLRHYGATASAIAAEAAGDLAAAGIRARLAEGARESGASRVQYHYFEDRALAEAVAAALPGALPVERAAPGAGEPAPPGRIEVRLVSEASADAGP